MSDRSLVSELTEVAFLSALPGRKRQVDVGFTPVAGGFCSIRRLNQAVPGLPAAIWREGLSSLDGLQRVGRRDAVGVFAEPEFAIVIANSGSSKGIPGDAAVIRVGCKGLYSPAQIAGWTSVQMPDGFVAAIGEGVFLVAEAEHVLVGFAFMTLATSTIDGIFVSPRTPRTSFWSVPSQLELDAQR